MSYLLLSDRWFHCTSTHGPMKLLIDHGGCFLPEEESHVAPAADLDLGKGHLVLSGCGGLLKTVGLPPDGGSLW